MLDALNLKSSGFETILKLSSTDLDSRFNQEITRLFYKQAPFVSTSLFFVLALSYYYLHGRVPSEILTSWLAFNLLVSISLLLLYVAYQFHVTPDNTQQWQKAYVIMVLLQDLPLGLLGPMSLLLDAEVDRLFILFLLAGMAAGAIATRGIQFRVYLLSVSGLLLPVAITYASMHYALANVMLALTLVFYVFMLFVCKNYSGNISSNIHLWLNLQQEIEARKRTEVELRSAKQRAEVASEAKNQFLASVSHELRTPLNGIIGFSSALDKQPLGETEKGYLNQIHSCSRSLLSMVNDILDVTTFEAGHLQLREYAFDLAHEMDEVAALGQRLCEDKGLLFEYHIDPQVPLHLIGDVQRVKQVITNLLNNAIKYTEQGHVRLCIDVATVEGESVRLSFIVEDSGIGIPQNARATLFDTFTQATNFDERKHDGVGLGLAIVKSLLQKLRGEITFDSEVGKGSRFEVRLPFTLSEGAAAAVQASEATGHTPSRPHTFELSRLKVLIVDDNDVNRLVLKTFLAPYQVPCTEAESGGEALKLLQAEEYDLVLLDINMPDMSGLEVHQRFCRDGQHCPHFVAVTAHALRHEVDHILASGFDECLIKPIAEDELIGLLKRIAAQHA